MARRRRQFGQMLQQRMDQPSATLGRPGEAGVQRRGGGRHRPQRRTLRAAWRQRPGDRRLGRRWGGTPQRRGAGPAGQGTDDSRLGLAFDLSEKLEVCPRGTSARVKRHIAACFMAAELRDLGRPFSATGLVAHMQHDKKMRDGRLAFVLARDIGAAFTSRDVPPDAVLSVLRDAGCS